MARAGKKGLDYFSVDSDMSSDPKIKHLKARCGMLGVAVFIELLQNIYKHEGYFVLADEDFKVLLADDCRLDYDKIEAIINECVKRDLFDSFVYEKYKILTSRRIQKNFLQACERRKEVLFMEEYLLISPKNEKTKTSKVNVNILSLNANILDLNVNIEKQTEKETEKENEKENDNNIESENSVVDVSSNFLKDFEAALQIAKAKVGITNPEGYARNMLKNGFTAEQEKPKPPVPKGLENYKFDQEQYNKEMMTPDY